VSVVCLDTQVLTWAIQAIHGQRSPIRPDPGTLTTAEKAEWEERKAQALGLLSKIDDEGDTASLPAVVVGELLCAVPVPRHAKLLGVLGARFLVHPYDAPSAALYGQLWVERHKDGTASALRAAARPRGAINADLMIVATAMRWKAVRIYSHDGGMKKLAEGHIVVKEMPPKPQVQQFLFPKPVPPTKP